jgi:hypothetical protein
MNAAERAAHAVAQQMGGGVQHSGGDWRVRCPVHGGEDRHLSIKNGTKGADIVVRCYSHGCDPRDILKAIAAAGGRAPREDRRSSPIVRPVTVPDQGKLDWLMKQLQPIASTVVETYLRDVRGVDPPIDGHLRFLPANPPKYPWPCMVGIITDFAHADRVLSLHITRLAPDGSDKAPLPKSQRRSFFAGYPIKNGIIRLCDDAEVTLRLGVAEGIETALAVTTAFRRGEGRFESVWAALSATNLAYLPVLHGIETLIVYGDRGQAGETAAERLAARWVDAGREAFICIAPIDDWNPEITP